MKFFIKPFLMTAAAVMLCCLFQCQKSADPGAGADPTDLLPADEDISGFKKKGDAAVMTDYQTIMDAIDGAAEKYIDYGFVEGVQQMYSNGNVDIDVQIFNHGSSENAKGIFQEFYPQSAETVMKENPEIVIDLSLIGAYTVNYIRNSMYMAIITSEKSDFARNMAMQFTLNVDVKIGLE
jgi:hypothetical protein